MSQSTPQPHVDDHVATPETREEYIDGRLMEAMPSHPEHADTQAKLARVLDTTMAPGYRTSVDMLTRTSVNWNFAADVAIRKEGPDPETGHRHLEELAFEVKHTQSMDDLTRRAEQLANRGVRRVFAVCVAPGEVVDEIKAGPVLEWSPDKRAWIELALDSVIEDPCLQIPLPVRALIDAAEAENAEMRTMLARDENPLLREHDRQVYARGEAQGLRAAILDICELLGIEMTADMRARLDAMDTDELHALRTTLKTERRWPEP